MTLEERARALADTFVNGMFSGHAELYREELRDFLIMALGSERQEALAEALMATPDPTARAAIRALLDPPDN